LIGWVKALTGWALLSGMICDLVMDGWRWANKSTNRANCSAYRRRSSR
jgi:hypothetical protein